MIPGTRLHRVAAGDTSQGQARPELPALTSLRFFAAMAVVLFHFERPWISFDGAYQAVTFFFVLSGFVLTYVYAGGGTGLMTVAPRQFFTARFIRLAPTYVVSIIVTLPLLIYGYASQTISAEQTITTAIAMPLLPLSPFLPHARAWDPPVWSLAVEAWLYIAFPLLVRPLFRWPLIRTVTACAVLALGLLVARLLLLRLAPTAQFKLFLYYFPGFYFPHFVAGILAARLFLFGPKLNTSLRQILFAAGIGAVALLALVPLDWQTSDGVLIPAFAAVIIGATGGGQIMQLLSARALITLGGASYAIYLLHWPLHEWWDEISSERLPNVFYLLAVVGGALIVFRWIERPMRGWLLRITGSAPRR
jgi:peptidoglycan/LPS O-acetylase OafA/YrhL